MRVGDAERDAAVAALREHMAAGRLTAEEFDERMGAALAARTWADVECLFLDLPPLGTSGETSPVPVPVSEKPPEEAGGHGQPWWVWAVAVLALIWVLGSLHVHSWILWVVIPLVLIPMSRNIGSSSQHQSLEGRPPKDDPRGGDKD